MHGHPIGDADINPSRCRAASYDGQDEPIQDVMRQTKSFGYRVDVDRRGRWAILGMGVPGSDEMEAFSMKRVDFPLLGESVRVVGSARSPIGRPRPGRACHQNSLALEPGEELTSGLALPPSELSVGGEVPQDFSGEHQRLAGRADVVAHHAAIARWRTDSPHPISWRTASVREPAKAFHSSVQAPPAAVSRRSGPAQMR